MSREYIFTNQIYTYETSHESIPLTQEHDYIGEFHMATKKQIYNHMKTIGIVLAAIGIMMIIYTGFNYVTKEKVVDLGPIEINKEKSHPVQWSPIVGVVLLVGGIIVVLTDKKSRT